MAEKRRRKTGCLTCRTRRVKCDERKPDCERCETANVECAGYAEKRKLKIRYPGQGPTATNNIQNGDSSLPTPPASTLDTVKPAVAENALPLVALPNNPNPSQRPHSRARDMLGYHQYLYRTLPILFPSKSFHFWRDLLCEAAWETEWVFDAIVALGSIHRAVLLLSQEGGNCRDRGLDTKITAIQTYIRALEGLSADLALAQSPTPLAVGTMVLMAYIECFSGNISAAIRHTQVIQYYSYTMRSDDKIPVENVTTPIELSIRDLELICRIMRPFPSPLEPISLSNAEKSTINLPSSFFEMAPGSDSAMLQQLLEFTSADLDLKHLVWCVYAAHYKSVCRDKVLAFLKALDDWKANNASYLSISPSEEYSHPSSYQTLAKLPLPPTCYEGLQRDSCLVFALYTFYRARLLWALCLLGDPDGSIELDAYLHIYRFMRYTRTALTVSNQPAPDAIRPCESLRIGFSPLLYLAGRCCPTTSWLRWIIQELGVISEGGLFHPKPFATTLDILLLLEQQRIRTLNPSSDGERLVPPHSRIIALFIPDFDGRSFEAYYARPEETEGNSERVFNISRVARWSDGTSGTGPVIQDYEIYQQQFSRDWLLQQPLVHKWVDWSLISEFDFNQVIQDHITGNRLLLEVGQE